MAATSFLSSHRSALTFFTLTHNDSLSQSWAVVRWVTKAEAYLKARYRQGRSGIHGAGHEADGVTAMTHRKGGITRSDLKHKWPHYVAVPAEKVRDP
jgi:hypothetical protein